MNIVSLSMVTTSVCRYLGGELCDETESEVKYVKRACKQPLNSARSKLEIRKMNSNGGENGASGDVKSLGMELVKSYELLHNNMLSSNPFEVHSKLDFFN